MIRPRPTRHRAAPASVASAAAFVVSWRLAMLARMAARPTPARRREAVRMIAEKVAAVLEAALAMQLEAARQAGFLCHGRRTERRLVRAGRSILDAGAAPARRRVRANARRLRRRKRM
jgi:hypothetical protein